MKLSYDEIRRIHRLEKNTSNLVEVEPDFYNELYGFLKEEKQAYLESLKDFSVSGSRDFTNMKKMIEEIFSMREKKIISRALVSSRTKEFSHSHMALQESELFKKIVSLIEEHGFLLEKLFSDEKAGSRKSADELETLHVKMVSDVPSFVGSDMKEYGPFQKDDSIELPLKIARLLNQRNLAVISEKVS